MFQCNFQWAKWNMEFKNRNRQECHSRKLVIRGYKDNKTTSAYHLDARFQFVTPTYHGGVMKTCSSQICCWFFLIGSHRWPNHESQFITALNSAFRLYNVYMCVSPSPMVGLTGPTLDYICAMIYSMCIYIPMLFSQNFQDRWNGNNH